MKKSSRFSQDTRALPRVGRRIPAQQAEDAANMCEWGREEGSAAGSFPFKCGSAHMEPHCAAPRMRVPSAGPGRASSAARPGTKGGGAATPSPSDTPLTSRSPPPPVRAQHPGPVRPPARSPTPPPPRPSRPLAPGGAPPSLPASPPIPIPPAACPVLSPRPVPAEPPPLLLTTKGQRPPPPGHGRWGGTGEGRRDEATAGPRGKGCECEESAWARSASSGGGGNNPPSSASFRRLTNTPEHLPAHIPRAAGRAPARFSPRPRETGPQVEGTRSPPGLAPGRWGGPTRAAGATPRSPGGTGAAEGTLPRRAGPAPLPRLPWQQSPVGLPLPRSA